MIFWEILWFFEANWVLTTALIAWAISCVLKGLINILLHREFKLNRFFGSGGMPSTHSATVVSLATIIGLEEGFDTTYFALSLVFALVVMYDASGVRRAAGQHARFINVLMEAIMAQDPKEKETKLKEVLGHTPFEVFAGAALGIAIAVVSHIYYPAVDHIIFK